MILLVLIIPSIILFYMTLLNIYRCKFSILEIMLSFSTTYILLAFTMIALPYMFPNLDIDIIGNITVAVCLFILVYKKSREWILSGYYTTLTLITTMISSSVSGLLFDIIFNTDIYNSRDNMTLYFTQLIPTFLACYFFSRYLGNYIHRFYIQLSDEVKREFAKYGFILSSLTYIVAHINLFAYRIVEDRNLLATMNLLVIVVVFFVALIMTYQHAVAHQHQMEADMIVKAQNDLVSYTKKLEDAYSEMRRFRHDHLNILHGLIGYTENSDQDGLKSYLTQNLFVAKESLEALDKSMDQLKFIHLPELKGLLAIKFAQAQSQDIMVNLDITKPIDEIPMERVALCRIVGIIVDNAVEELLAQDYEHKELSFGIIIDGSDILIICTNTCKTSPPIEKIFTLDYTTKGSGRGVGLYDLKQICKKSGNVLVSSHVKNDIFTIIITLRKRTGAI